ncbi:peptidylprolyl isomerase [Sphaerotilus mobilis]|uniref:Chaperone SurA n=1 Tax=Sphaerotilus mobilis TaxID=47994 RepID=A0A4Q7LKD1_9BURK|nr:peptidylprolyl isomerase [Sphaerotilus mobilis]RZS54612.1 periplasmic chaperone for outer membrane proteins SurA [Sphaerotilus mobilis]
MTSPDRPITRAGSRRLALALHLAACLAAGASLCPLAAAQAVSAPAERQEAARQSADYIVAIVNRELVTNSEVQARLQRVEAEAGRSGAQLPGRDVLLREVLDQLIDERAQLTHAAESGLRIDEAELDRTVASVAAQNQLSVSELRERLRADGQDYARFRDNLRDRLALERVRERDVQARLRIVDADIENWLAREREKAGAVNEYNIAQILIAVPETATPAEAAARRAQAVSVLQRLKAGEDFGALVKSVSQASKANNGELGLRRGDALPDLFVEAVRPLFAGEVAPQVVRSGAGFHILKLVERRDAALSVTQTRARHILLRPSPGSSETMVIRRLEEFRQRIAAGRARFDELARQHSEDGSAPGGGDLGWASPGQFVPEFEQAMQSLALNEVSAPVVSRFGVHLIQVLERKQVSLDVRQQREAARAALREQKYEETYLEWAREVRARAYVELREPPGL